MVCAGLVFLGLRFAGLTGFIGGGLGVAIVFGAPALGAFLFFCARYLSRLAGIDNDHIYKRPLSARGLSAWLLALVLTSFYIVIYLEMTCACL